MDGISEDYVGPGYWDEVSSYRKVSDSAIRRVQEHVLQHPIPGSDEYVWQDFFRSHRRSAVEAFGLTNHSDQPRFGVAE